MLQFFKAIGGPIGLLVLGFALAGFTTPYAVALVPLGLFLWLWQRSGLEIRRKPHVPLKAPPPAAGSKEAAASWKELNRRRNERYDQNHGLFLIHMWRPSKREGQVADVVIRLWQHGPGPLTSNEIEAVEYTLGPKFSDHSRVCTDPKAGFAIEESMFGPMLCLASVYFKDDRPPMVLERYINFVDETAERE